MNKDVIYMLRNMNKDKSNIMLIDENLEEIIEE